MVCRLIIAILFMHAVVHAQEWIDDDAALPLLDAVDMYRTAPLSLHTASVDELLTIPGFTPMLAARLRATFRRDTTLSLDALADTLCLAPSQRVLLHVCCSRTPPSPGFLRSAATRVRIADVHALDDAQRATYARVQVSTSVGSASMLSTGSWRGGTLDLRSDHVSLIAGTMTMSSSMGLILGAPIFLGKGASLDAPARWSGLQLTSWRSVPSANVLDGVAVSIRAAPGAVSVMQGRLADASVRAGAANVSVSNDITATCTYANVDGVSAVSVGARYQRTSLLIGAELAIAPTFAASALMQWIAPSSTFVLNARHLPATWTIPTAAPFADGTGRNESGVFVGMRMRTHGWTTTTWIDVFRTHAAPFGVPAPRTVTELFGETEKRIARGTTLNARIRYESSTQRVTPDTTDRTLAAQRDRLSARLSLVRSLLPTLSLRVQTGAQHAAFDRLRSSELSWMCALDVQWQVRNTVRVAARWQTYDGASMHTALYSFDYRVPGSFGSTPLLGTGARWLVSTTWQPLDQITVSAAVGSDGRAVVQLDLMPLAK